MINFQTSIHPRKPPEARNPKHGASRCHGAGPKFMEKDKARDNEHQNQDNNITMVTLLAKKFTYFYNLNAVLHGYGYQWIPMDTNGYQRTELLCRIQVHRVLQFQAVTGE